MRLRPEKSRTRPGAMGVTVAGFIWMVPAPSSPVVTSTPKARNISVMIRVSAMAGVLWSTEGLSVSRAATICLEMEFLAPRTETSP